MENSLQIHSQYTIRFGEDRGTKKFPGRMWNMINSPFVHQWCGIFMTFVFFAYYTISSLRTQVFSLFCKCKNGKPWFWKPPATVTSLESPNSISVLNISATVFCTSWLHLVPSVPVTYAVWANVIKLLSVLCYHYIILPRNNTIQSSQIQSEHPPHIVFALIKNICHKNSTISHSMKGDAWLWNQVSPFLLSQ